MGPWSARQLAALGAVVATALYIVGFGLFGSSPKFSADPTKIIGYFHDHHKRVLVAVVLIEIATAPLIALLAQLAVILRDAGSRAEAAVVGIGGAAAAGSLAVGIALYGGLAQLSTFGGGLTPSPDQLSVSPLYRLTQFIQVGWAWMMVVVVATVALAVWRGAHAQWVAIANAIVAVLLVLGGIAVRGTGPLAAGTGIFAGIALVAFLVWVLHLSAVFWTRRVDA
jgi:hypothetical protein